MRITIEPNTEFEFESGQKTVIIEDVETPSLFLYTDVKNMLRKALIAWGFLPECVDRLLADVE